MTTSTVTVVLVVLVVVTAALDLISTAIALRKGIGKEANPLMRSTNLVRAILKVVAMAVIFYAASRANHTASIIILSIAAVVWGAIAAWNFSVILKARR